MQKPYRRGVLAVALVAVEVFPHLLLELVVAARCRDARQVAVESADGLVDRYAIVVEDDKDVGL